MGLKQTQKLAQSLTLTHQQRQQLLGNILQLRLGLIKELRGDSYKPEASCPKCFRVLTPVEIIQGFNRDPNDFTTSCTSCGHRFRAEIVARGETWTQRLQFFCATQVLEMLRGKETLSPEQIRKENPGAYHSAIVHHGGLRQAFKQIDITYKFDDLGDWKDKIKDFLGRLPDTDIARAVGVSSSVISNLRRSLNIDRFRVGSLVSSISE